MIKKAVLLLLTAPFLMVFSDDSQAIPGRCITRDHTVTSVQLNGVLSSGALSYYIGYTRYDANGQSYPAGGSTCVIGPSEPDYEYYFNNPLGIPPKTDEECSAYSGSSVPLSPSSANYLTSGGSVSAAGGACSVTGTKSVCGDFNGETMCTVTLSSTSTGLDGDYLATIGKTPEDINLLNSSASPAELNSFNPPSYLEPLPGQCSDNSSCVSIGDSSYLVDWETAPDWFSYVGSDGQTYSKPQQEPTDPSDGNGGGSDGGGDVGGGCFTNCYPDDGSGGSDGGNDSGGSTGGGSSGGSGDDDSGNDSGGSTGGGSSGGGSTGGGSSGGGGSTGGDDSAGGGSSDGGGSGSDDGSTVPDFEFDESGIIEAIGSAGESNQQGLDAVSNDITNAIDEQTEATKGLFDGLGNTITNALGLGTCYPDDDAATSDKGLLGCIQNIANGMVNNFVDRLTNPDGMPSDADVEGMIDGEGTVDSLMDSLDQGAEEQKETIYQEFEGTFESGGIIDGTLKPLRDFVTSFLPRIPNGGCTPLVFGTGPRSFTIDCEGFNLLKAALSWILFFFTAYQLIAIPMDARKTQ